MRLHALFLALGLGCSMQQSNGPHGETEPKRVEKSESPSEKAVEKAPRPERKMTDAAKAAIAKLSDSNASVVDRIEAARKLAELEDPASVVPMMVTLEVELPEALEDEIQKALDLIGATKVLAEDLAGGDDAARADAASLLGRRKDGGAVAPLMKALADPAAKVRENAAGSLGILGAKEAEAALVERLEKDAAPDVRGAAAQSLGLLKTAGAKPALEKALAAEKDDFVKVLIQQAIAAVDAH